MGRKAALSIGEGTPDKWSNLKIIELTDNQKDMFNDLLSLIVGSYNFTDTNVNRVIGSICIYRSDGKIEKLPISTLLEIINIFIFSKILNVKGVVLVPIAEEKHNFPDFSKDFEELGEKISKKIINLSRYFNLSIEVDLSVSLREDSSICDDELYGLFRPFSDGIEKYYPLGNLKEKSILRGYQSYCLRYRYPLNTFLQCNDLIIDGLHLAKSVILGIRNNAKYIVTCPYSSMNISEEIALVDSSSNISIEKIKVLDNFDKYNQIYLKILGKSIYEIIELWKIC